MQQIVEDIDLDFELPLSRAAHRMAEAKDMLTILESLGACPAKAGYGSRAARFA
jgi:hypothetical protein